MSSADAGPLKLHTSKIELLVLPHTSVICWVLLLRRLAHPVTTHLEILKSCLAISVSHRPLVSHVLPIPTAKHLSALLSCVHGRHNGPDPVEGLAIRSGGAAPRLSFMAVSPPPSPHLSDQRPVLIHALHLVGSIAFVVFRTEGGLQPISVWFYWKAAMPTHLHVVSEWPWPQWQSGCRRHCSGWQNWKYSLIGPLQKKFASPWTRGQNTERNILTFVTECCLKWCLPGSLIFPSDTMSYFPEIL